MSDSEINKEYEAIVVDTSIFDSNGLRLETGLLGQIKQFRESPIEYLLPDVIKNEIQSHLEKKIKVARSALEKSINEAGYHLFFDGSALNNAKQLLIDSHEIKSLAYSRLTNFIKNTGALVIDCGEFVSVQKVLESYFSNTAPFSETGKKKNEFPDAIVLLAIEEWAEREDKKVLAIAQDNDWKAYCKTSNRIDYLESFSEGLASFQTATAPFVLVGNLKVALDNEVASSFLQKLETQLSFALDGLTPDQEADSHLYWEPEGSNGWFKNFELINHEFRVIDSDDEWVVFEISAKITIEAEGEFSLSVYDSIDRDHVGMGSVSALAEADFESEILITLSGDLSGDINDLEIDEVEVVDQISSVDFGTIDLDYGEGE
ncbi:PIN domain-containing protein [Candidatus Sororendozoicomonas aggregata]|uniref:PIN domain-containing protein n=1 Tax=Candidatus Sororendozoicomonas aggregata TaxID=3073239 RepID=UPI002ED25223